jgi:hypothetical protein
MSGTAQNFIFYEIVQVEVFFTIYIQQTNECRLLLLVHHNYKISQHVIKRKTC